MSRRKATSAFGFDWYSSEAGIDAYVRECWATGDEQMIRDGEFLARIARDLLAKTEQLQDQP
jgi:hypothetical protein